MTELKINSESMIKKEISYKDNKTKPSFKTIPIKKIIDTNKEMGLALSDLEIDYLIKIYTQLKDPTDVELMMFSQINSEHCRHKIFNSDFTIDNKKQNKTLFQLIKDTFYKNNKDVISAYKDNSSIIKGNYINELFIDNKRKYRNKKSDERYIIKAETHNHPTAISLMKEQLQDLVVKLEMRVQQEEGQYLRLAFADLHYQI